MEVVIDIIKKEGGKHFDPGIVDIFLKDVDQFLNIREEISPNQKLNELDFIWSERDSDKYDPD